MADETTKTASITDHRKLEQVALSIFNRLSIVAPTGKDTSNFAIESFRRAKSFLAVSDGVESGDISAEPIPADKTEYIEIPVWQQQSDEKWSEVKDPVTGKVVTTVAPVDPYAYAPNLPHNHPINLRFKPKDGITLAERQADFKRSREPIGPMTLAKAAEMN